jgi:hypothetical protein
MTDAAAQVFFVKKVRCVEKCRRIYHAKMFLIIKINAKVLTQLQTNTNQTKTTDEKTRELLCLLPQKITKNLLKLQRPSDKEPPNINTPPARTKYCCVSANNGQLEIKIKFHMEYAEKEKGLDLPYAKSQPDVHRFRMKSKACISYEIK